MQIFHSLLCKLIYFAGCRHRHRSYTVVCMLACFPAALCERRENLKYQDFRVKRYEYIKFSLFFSFFSIACHCISFRILFVVRIAWIVFSSKFFHRDNSLTPLILTFYFLHRLLPPINFWYDFCWCFYLPFYVCRHFYFTRHSNFLVEIRAEIISNRPYHSCFKKPIEFTKLQFAMNISN